MDLYMYICEIYVYLYVYVNVDLYMYMYVCMCTCVMICLMINYIGLDVFYCRSTHPLHTYALNEYMYVSMFVYICTHSD